MLSQAFKKWDLLCITKEKKSSIFFWNKSLSEQAEFRIKTFYQIAFLMLATLIVATSFNCSLIFTVTVNLEKTNSISASSIVTSASEAESTATNDSDNYMTIAMINMYDKQLSLSFALNADDSSSIDNSLTTTLSDNVFTQYAFSTEWAERIYVGSNLNLDDSKIKGSYTNSSDIDVSYVNDYYVSITCFFENTAVFDCNIDLFKQLDISCNDQVDNSVCLNFAQNILNELASSFFAVCAEAVYIYSNDNDVNVSNLKSILIFCCIDTSCNASWRQPKQDNTSHDEHMRIRVIKSHLSRRSVSSSFLSSFLRRHRHRHYSSRYLIHE